MTPFTKTAAALAAAIIAIAPAGCARTTPEEELMMDLQSILRDAYGKECKVRSIHVDRSSREQPAR